MYRLAELYLNFAEAAYRAYGNADQQAPATDVEETVTDDEGNETTSTVTYGVAMSARDAVNAVELAFEEHRFFDVRRWTKPDGDLSKTDKRVTGMRIELSDGQKVYSRFSFDRQSYTSKYLKYPISLDEVRKMLSLTGENWQNDGWN